MLVQVQSMKGENDELEVFKDRLEQYELELNEVKDEITRM